MLENLVHWQTNRIPPTLVYAVLNVPEDLAQEIPPRPDLPESDPNDYRPYRRIGDEWYRRGETAVLRVPSVLSPYESNLLINQTHEDFPKITLHRQAPASLHSRPWPVG